MQNENARQRRKHPTKSEGLLWSILRARQVSGLKFRREHPIGPWIADFACFEKYLIVEIDGDYHDLIEERDLKRQQDLEERGWRVIRFSADEVEQDAEAVAQAISSSIGVEYHFFRRGNTGSGKFFRGKKK